MRIKLLLLLQIFMLNTYIEFLYKSKIIFKTVRNGPVMFGKYILKTQFGYRMFKNTYNSVRFLIQYRVNELVSRFVSKREYLVFVFGFICLLVRMATGVR